MTDGPVLHLPDLPRTPRPDPAVARRRGLRLALLVGAVLVALLVAWASLSGGDRGQQVVVAAPAGSRLSVDGEPQPALGRDGNHLLFLAPGRHELQITLRSGEQLVHEVQVEGGPGSVRVEVRWDKVYGRWRVAEPEGTPQVDPAG